MTSIYRVTAYAHLNTLSAEESSWHYILEFLKNPTSWKPIQVWSAYSLKRDFINFSNQLVCMNKTRSVLEKILNGKIRFLSLRDDQRDFWMIMINNSIQCLDFDRSQFSLVKNSSKVFMHKYAFLEAPVRDELLFTIPELSTTNLFATDRFKTLIEEELKLTGLEFELLWSSDTNVGSSTGEKSDE